MSVAMHDGTIEAKSDGPGQGSEFIIRLPIPVVVQLPMTEKPPVLTQQLPRQFNILVVDDNESAAKSLGKLLEYKGHNVAVAYGWKEALAALSANKKIEVALLDIGMPDVDGYDLARLIVQDVVPAPTLIALSGYGQDEHKRKAYEAGFRFHLTKPISIVDIEGALAKVPLRATEYAT